MPRGGRRNRSGPGADPSSGRSERRGYALTALPAEGYDGPVPDFPLPRRLVIDVVVSGSGREQTRTHELNEDATQETYERELELWEWLWGTPQACAWSMPSERWRLHTIALYTRTFVVCEGATATAADKGSLHRFADQIGMTTAGLREMGWAVAVDELAEKRAEPGEDPEDEDDPRNRMPTEGAADGGG